MRNDVFQRMLPDQDGRGFEMDALMLDTHHDRPPWTIPANWQGERSFPYQSVYNISYLRSIKPHLLDRRPIVMGCIQVVPTHFIDPHREHGFQSGVNSLGDQPGKQQFVCKEGRRMSKVEDQGMAQ